MCDWFNTNCQHPFSAAMDVQEIETERTTTKTYINNNSTLNLTLTPNESNMCTQYNLSNDQVKDCRFAFSLFDNDGDEKISANELANVMTSLGQTASKKEIQTIMKQFNKSEDDCIRFDEFVKMLVQHSKQDVNKIKLNLCDAFAIFDKNGDGFITANELKEVMRNLGERLTDKEVQQMITAADKNGDRRVDFEEFINVFTIIN